MSQSIYFSAKAANKVAELIAAENNPQLNLRIAISGGGCSGFLYNFSLDEEINEEDDTVITQEVDTGSPVKLLIDSLSYQYLQGAEVDYEEGIEGSFIIRNPHAKTTCGCGSSFSMDED